MTTGKNIGDLLYINEHFSCRNYLADVTTGFKFEELPVGAAMQQESVTQNYILMILQGECTMTSGFYPQRIFKEGEMVLIPKSSRFEGEVIKDVKVLVFSFDIPLSSCDKFTLESYSDYCRTVDYNFSSIPIRTPLKDFADLLIYLLNKGMKCGHLFEIKHKEFFLLLRGFYSKEEIVTLLYPIISRTLSFKDFILENYTKVESIEQLIERSHLSRSSFYQKFKEDFGITAKQWMLKQQARAVRAKASEPHVSIKDLMDVLNYSSPAQFNRFCREYLGCTPGELLRLYQS